VQIVGMGPSSTTVLFPSEGDFGTPHKLIVEELTKESGGRN